VQRRNLLLSSLATLAGCAGQSVPQSDTPAQGAATLVFSVTHNPDAGITITGLVEMASARNGKLERRSFASIETPFGIQASADFGDVYGKLYVVSVQPGRFVFGPWRVTQYAKTVTPNRVIPALVVEPQAGDVLYLGNFHFDFHKGRATPEARVYTSMLATVQDRASRDTPLAERKSPLLLGKVRTALLSLGPWYPE
jgi:hypothetical protein